MALGIASRRSREGESASEATALIEGDDGWEALGGHRLDRKELRCFARTPSTLALGNLMSAQFFEAALRAHPDIPDEIERGRFDTLRGWLAANIHVHGRARTADEIVLAATGRPLSTAPYLAYLRGKYGALYGL